MLFSRFLYMLAPSLSPFLIASVFPFSFLPSVLFACFLLCFLSLSLWPWLRSHSAVSHLVLFETSLSLYLSFSLSLSTSLSPSLSLSTCLSTSLFLPLSLAPFFFLSLSLSLSNPPISVCFGQWSRAYPQARLSFSQSGQECSLSIGNDPCLVKSNTNLDQTPFISWP